MTVRRGEDVALTASFAGERRELTDANILRAWSGNPLMTFTVIAGIHWEALKMWLKGVRYLGRGKVRSPTLGRPRKSGGVIAHAAARQFDCDRSTPAPTDATHSFTSCSVTDSGVEPLVSSVSWKPLMVEARRRASGARCRACG